MWSRTGRNEPHRQYNSNQNQNTKETQRRQHLKEHVTVRHHYHYSQYHHYKSNRKLQMPTMQNFLLWMSILLIVGLTDASNYFDTQGPNFAHEPPSRIEFTNTAGNIADCIAHGNPPPNVEWLDKENNPITSISKVRHILANGSLYFPPFEADEFRQDVHWSIYRCVATNAVGAIVSRDVVVKAVVNQRYEPEVQNPGGFIGSNVLIKCNIPSFVKEYVTVTSWLQEPNFNIYPSLEGDGKNHMLPTGELLVYNITRTDALKIYRCRTHHKLTQDSVVSSNVGKIQLTEMRELVPPIMNEKVVSVTARVGDPVVVPCVAYANPKPVYRWHTKRPNNEESIQHLLATGRAKIKDGTLIITAVDKSDNGAFYCTANNSEGSETLEVQMSVTSPLTAAIQPTVQTVNLGKTADLICSISGFPKQSISWLKDGHPLRAGARVRLLSKEHMRITSITKEDKGMYQCMVKNDLESVQATAELRLGEVAPQLIYKFIEQTMQPGPSVSLKCSASGNPTPKIVWQLDGFALPNNDRLMIGQYVTMFGDVISHVNISAVKSEDGGDYECKAISRAGEASHTARLNIYGMPYVRPMPKLSAVAGKTFFLKCPVAGYPIDSIIIEKVPPKITPFSFARDLNVGDRTSIQCVIGTGDLPLTFTWLKDGKPLQTAGTAAMQSTHSARDSGSVSGGISGTGDVAASGSGSHTTSINYAHAHSHGAMSYTNDDGSSGGEGGGGVVTIRQNDDFTSALSITSVTRAQSGTYTCRVQNDAATVSHSAQLRVNVPPRISPFSFEDEITEGMRTQLMCSSSQGDQPFNITWLKDGVPIQSGSAPDGLNNLHDTHMGAAVNGIFKTPDPSLTLNEYAPFSSILSIHNVTSRHNGNYTCRVTNRAGSVEYVAMLSVSVPPRWIIKPADQDAILGNPVVIRCQADGFPVPSVQWKQSIGDSGEYRELSYSIPNGNSKSVIETHNNGSLIIPKVGREHEGSYLCQANNGIGAGLSQLIKLTVHVGPTVTVSKKQVTVRRGDRVTLRCEADGDQPLDISWRAKANRIDPSFDVRYHIKDSPLSRGIVSELTILQTILSDRGEYTCIASNSYGHDRAVIHLQVQEPPNFPVNLHATDLGSRSVTLAWSPNDQDTVSLGGNNRDSQPISNYILQYKKAGDVWHEGNNQKLLPGDKTTAQIGSLRPAQAYHFRLYAENHLGTSAPSDILLVQTDAEAPSGRPQDVSAEPLGPQQLLITWRPPERDSWNGELLGYTIAYQKHGSSDNFQNFTKVSNLGGEGLNDFRLTGLEKYTQYAVTVCAFNVKGDGPPSEVALGHTLEDAPSAPPQGVTCIALTAQNIQISWQSPPKENHHGVIQGYKVLYEPGNFDSEYGTRETKITSALSTVLHGLQPFTNYSVQVLAFTRAGEGVVSATVSCTTEEAVPDAPERVKSVVNSESSVIISWLPPRRPNGIVTKYNVYIRILDKGQELKILKEVLPAQNRHFEAKDLSTRETYEAWVTASTRVGQGPSTPVIKLIPSSSVPAAIISFSQTLSVSWRVDMKLPCLFVGSPKPNAEWKVLNARSKKHFRLEVSNDNTLTLRSIQRSHEGNYSCVVRNAIGSDHIVYQLFVQVPPSAPVISVIGTTANSVSLQWRVDDIGGAPLRGFTLTFRKEFGDWEEIQLDRRVNSHLLEDLQCGTSYQFTIVTFNKIGTSATSPIEIAKTQGNKPNAPTKHSLIRANITSALIELSSWQDGGCPIQYFSIEFKRYGISSDWIIVSSRIESHTRYTIGDLEAGTLYNLRVTAHNNAGSTVKEYTFETLRFSGMSNELDQSDLPEVNSLFRDAHLIAVIITSVFGTILALIGACICFKNYPRHIFSRNVDTLRPPGIEGKDLQHREQYYGTMRKSCQQSPGDSVVALERIPEYSEDIYPYATFHLPEHENQSANIPLNRKGMQPMYDPRSGDDNTLSSSGMKVKRSVSGSGNISMGGGECSHTNTEKRHKRRSKAIKSESEEYDSLNSDSDLSGERIRDDNRSTRTDASSQLENSGYNIHGHSPRSGSSNKERLSVFSRPQLHKNILPNRPKDSTNESLHTSNGPAPESANQTVFKNPKRPSFKSPKSFFQIIKPTKILTNNSQRNTPPNACSTNLNLNRSPECVTQPKIRIQPKPPHQFVHLIQRPMSETINVHNQQPPRPPSPSPSYRFASSSKHENLAATTTTQPQPPHQQKSINNSRSSPSALIILKSSGSGSGSSDSVGYHKSSLSNSSMDAVPLDYRLFDPPPKQRKQQQQQSGSKAQSPKHHERQASDECAKNSTNHTNMSGSISGKVRSKTADNSSNSGNSLAGEFQCSPNSIPSPHIVQSGSYVEILKQAGNQAAIQASAAQHERLMGHGKTSLSSAATQACHNKSYGDFLTITPRRKGKLLGGDGKSGLAGETHDNYRHHLPHSIEPLHLLGIPNDNMSTFFDYRAMETLSNADTLAIGSTMAGHLYPSKIANNKQPFEAVAKNQSLVTDEYHHIINEKNLSPPSAFCDNISSMNKA